MDSSERLAKTRERFNEALVLGEAALARSLIEQAMSRGASHAEIYLEVLAPSQIRVGELWHEGSLNVAQEHLATTITMDMMDRLRLEMTPRTGLGVRAVVTPVEGDQHSVGARMIADFLAMDGWEVDFLGTGTPAKDLAAFVSQRGADLVALSSTVPEFLPNARAAAESVRALGASQKIPKILLGGGALNRRAESGEWRTDHSPLNTRHWKEALGCDAIAGNVLEAVSEARRLVGLADDRLTLEEHLALMGRRINTIRTSEKMTQQQLADASGLDRTYISLVEHGRQNLTIGAVLKIANALDVPVGELLALPSPGSET